MKLSFSRVFAVFAAVLSAWGTVSCTSKEPTTNEDPPENVDLAALKKEVVANYAKLVHASYADTLAAAKRLQADLVALTENPSADALAKARKTWTAARVPYLQTEVFRFYGGPIDDDDGPEGLLNAWPMDEGYIDYVDGNPEAGMINQAAKYPEITKGLIEELNEKDGETNISTGYHAIEFLLWGQDKSADGPGQRPHTDYSTAANADRRKTYLLAAADLLVENLEGLVAEWAPGADNYRKTFEADDPSASIEKIMTGMSMLSGFELSGERLLVATETQSQEDEHSCFSDTTHQDAIYDIQGMINVWEGSYGEVSGAGLAKLARALDTDLADKLEERVKGALPLAKGVPVPFDQAIASEEGRKAILELVTLLEDQAELLVQLSKKMGFEVPTAE